MKIDSRDGRDQRRFLAAMIMDDTFLARIAQAWKDKDSHGPFKDRWTNLVGSWCVKHWRDYGKAPKKIIEQIFKDWEARHPDSELAECVAGFIAEVSSDWQKSEGEDPVIAAEYNLDRAGDYFNGVKIDRLIEDLQVARDTNRNQEAISLVQGFKRVELGVESSVNPLTDHNLIKTVLSKRRIDPLIHYPGDLGRFFGRTLERDAFIAFQGVEKSGKSFWLLDMVWRALRERRKVAYFCTGDMSQEQCLFRFYTRAAYRPLVSEDGWPCTVRYPTCIVPGDRENPPDVKPKEKRFNMPKKADVIKAVDKFTKHQLRSNQEFLNLWVKPAGTVTVPSIRARLLEWEQESGFHPDVIVIDYADVLAPITTRFEKRDQIGETWEALRGLSQEQHCLLVTATQAASSGYGKYLQTQQDFSENKMKNAHVTGMVGINQWGNEKSVDVVRLNWIDRREGQTPPQVHVAGCRALANPAVCSAFS